MASFIHPSTEGKLQLGSPISRIGDSVYWSLYWSEFLLRSTVLCMASGSCLLWPIFHSLSFGIPQRRGVPKVKYDIRLLKSTLQSLYISFCSRAVPWTPSEWAQARAQPFGGLNNFSNCDPMAIQRGVGIYEPKPCHKKEAFRIRFPGSIPKGKRSRPRQTEGKKPSSLTLG